MLEHRFAIGSAVATFFLLLVGGLVNPTGSSLACPEPTMICNGELFPELTGGVLYEHGHRLVAMTVGFLQIALTILLWRRRPSLRWLGVGALAMVCTQGALGALTVQLKLPWGVSTAHLALAMLYLATLVYIAWRTRPDRGAAPASASLQAARPWIAAAGIAVFLQILLGGLMRHHGGALASVDLPLHHGSLWPAGAPLALKLHMAHRIGGVVVGLIVLAATAIAYRKARGHSRVRAALLLAPVLVAVQIGLGLLVITSYRDVWIVDAHFGVAALLWTTWWSLWLAIGGLEPAPARKSVADLPGTLAGARG